MRDRWVLNRAGITNVYQYADETLTFGGGRLLLRSVNGTGKSTAMNMPAVRRADLVGVVAQVDTEPGPRGELW